MEKIELIRLEKTEQGVVSVIRKDGVVFCCALEPPDNGNRPFFSCIPIGWYLIAPVKSPKFGDTYTILNVPGRSNILFHAGNTMADTEGCILVGETIGKLKGDRAVFNSGATFKRLLAMLGGKHHNFEIKEI